MTDQFMKKRLKKKIEKRNKFDPWAWITDLRSSPEKALECPYIRRFDGVAWWWILTKQPQLADLCNWQNFNGWDWASLLGFMPQYADKCSWGKLAGRDWRLLLLKRPDFFAKCDIEKLKWDDCKALLSDSSPLPDTAKEKVLQRYKQFKYAIGSLDGYNLKREKSQCGNCRFLISCITDHCCLYFPDEIPSEYWMNRKMCSHYSFRNLADSAEFLEFVKKYIAVKDKL